MKLEGKRDGKWRRAEITSTQIITFVLAIGGFIVVAMFILLLGNPGEQGADEACRFSVLTRATSPIESVNVNLPLKCTTKKICISTSGKNDACDEFVGEKNVRAVKLDGKTDAENGMIISREYADAMYNCWTLMGQGKLNIFSGGKRGDKSLLFSDFSDTTVKKRSTCVICSRVVLAKDIDDNVKSEIDVNDYMLRNSPVPNSDVSYTGYFSGSKDVKGYSDDNLFKGADGKTLPRNYPDQTAFVFMQIISDKDWLKAASEAGIGTTYIIGGAALANPIGTLTKIGPTVIFSLLAIGANAGISAWNADANQQLAAGYCGEFTGEGSSKGDRSQGCSVVKAAKYDVNSINSFCGILEGSP